ncbi:MAG: hypothetical protein HYU84_00990 [Chloroflexi bacterium]|nr:hypothetical protein [Chloroflexota bacterium]
MDREKEIRLAKASYSWLGISPILTIGTLFLIVSMGIGDSICDSGAITCYYNTDTYISFAIGILASALWHLTLLQYVNNKDSEFVRSHGQRALTQAGIRTGVAMFGVALDWFANADGGIACIAIIILLVIWAVNVSQSKHWVKSDNPPVTESMKTALNTPIVRTQPTKEILDQILEELNSEDDVIVLVAIDKLEQLAESIQPIKNCQPADPSHSHGGNYV